MKDILFNWSQIQEAAFLILSKSLCDEPIPKYPDVSKSFVLSTGACAIAIGAVLSQVHNGQEHPVTYSSRRLKKVDRNYCTNERELFALRNISVVIGMDVNLQP